MARKKKSKKKTDPEKASGDAPEEAAEAPADEPGTKEKASASKQREPTKKSSAKKKPRHKKKRARKKAAKKEAAESETVGEPAVEEVVDAPEPDSDHDVGEATPEEPVVLDLDEDFETLTGSEDLDELIAATVAGARPEDQVEEPPVESLDDEPPAEVIDEDVEEPEEAATTETDETAEEVAAEATEEPIARAPETAAIEAEEPSAEEPSAAPSTTEEDGGVGAASSPEVRDRLLAQALAHAEQQDARYRVPFSDPRPAGRLKAAAAASLLLVAGVLAVAPPAWVRPEPPAQIDDAARTRGLRASLLLQAQQVDAYRVRWQRLPSSLADLAGSLPGVRYVRSGNRAYQLIAYAPDGNAIVYDSSNPAPEFGRVTPSWIAEPVQ